MLREALPCTATAESAGGVRILTYTKMYEVFKTFLYSSQATFMKFSRGWRSCLCDLPRDGRLRRVLDGEGDEAF